MGIHRFGVWGPSTQELGTWVWVTVIIVQVWVSI